MSGKNTKAFLDANTIISGLLFKGNEATLLELGRIGALELVTNHYVIEEVSAVLKQEEFNLTQPEIQTLNKYLQTCVSIQSNPPDNEINKNHNLLNDKKDIPVALGAQLADADYLVTGDKELLRKISNATRTQKLVKNILPPNNTQL
jgi:putative PIN family toxin of toxin-antitoxin system